MVLDARLQKLAPGLTAARAAAAAPEEELDAMIEAMFLMAAVDDRVTGEELRRLADCVSGLVGAEVVEDELQAKLAEMNESLARDGWTQRLRAVAGRLRAPETRRIAFQLAAGVAFVDDRVEHSEAAAIEALAGALGLDHGESQRLLDETVRELFGG
ncbi:MAG: TerB family tellurite resistance protein [Polyangiaceae bacterium]|nr:TerB family tellurite resistance protein [Polyangiaceae bacterium]